ncbi:MAG: toxin co-regulated pilus biosynthesis Q family protein [Roseibium sp.]|uniref:toxin co-regulated pilus biosynthesis Q family protein n=1 Tax=Roseibium sp. TaxID=1936156 RepID=UPI003298BBB8
MKIGKTDKPDQSRRKALLGALAATVALSTTPMAAFADAAGPKQILRSGNQWAVLEGSSLKTTLEGWSDAAGWTLIWDNPVDYRLRASATFRGGFEEAVGRLIDSIYQHSPEINVHLYRGNRVLHVREQTLTSN